MDPTRGVARVSLRANGASSNHNASSNEQKDMLMPRGRKKPREIKVGDRVMIVTKGPTHGQRDAVVELGENGDVRLAGFGWHKRNQVEVLDEPIAAPPPNADDAASKAAAAAEAGAPPLSENGKRHGTVDGHEAIIDGTVPPQDEPFIKPALEDLVKSLARAQLVLRRATTEKMRASEAHKDALGQYNAIADEIVQHYGDIEQLALDFDAAMASDEGEPAPVS